MSGSRQDAGGVEGLLAIKNSSGVAQFPVFDGKGNLGRLVAGNDGAYSATYEYGPFGDTIRTSGSYASANPIRFSTKYRDSETDLYYFGHRYYGPINGRWMSRDPLLEWSFYSANHNQKFSTESARTTLKTKDWASLMEWLHDVAMTSTSKEENDPVFGQSETVIYSFLSNDSLNSVDPLGLKGIPFFFKHSCRAACFVTYDCYIAAVLPVRRPRQPWTLMACLSGEMAKMSGACLISNYEIFRHRRLIVQADEQPCQ